MISIALEFFGSILTGELLLLLGLQALFIASAIFQRAGGFVFLRTDFALCKSNKVGGCRSQKNNFHLKCFSLAIQLH